jgi:hypothetical protein
MSYVQEEACLYTGDLSVEKRIISTIMEEPSLSRLLAYIQSIPDASHAIGVLMVIIGIKPCLVFSYTVDPELVQIVEELSRLQRLKLKIAKGKLFLANEKPLDAFNPRHYLESFSDQVPLIEAIEENFTRQQNNNVQRLSYLLGYGPSWEAFANRINFHDGRISCFSASHYKQLGEALIANHVVEDSFDPLRVGVTYHCNFKQLINQTSLLNTHSLFSFLHKTGGGFAIDGIAIRTTYFKKSYTLKKWVLETYLNSSAQQLQSAS